MKSFIRRLKRAVLDHGGRLQFFRNIKTPARVLDLGCGGGHNGAALTQLDGDFEVHGVDLLEEHEVPSFISYKKVDLNKGEIPYPDEHFDAIVFTHVIEHLTNPLELGIEINRVLKTDGAIYVEAPNWISMLVPSFGFGREQHDPFNFFDDPSHVKPWTRHGLYEFLSQSCSLDVAAVGCVRNWRRIPFDLPIMIYGLARGRRGLVLSSVWNICGWCVYGVAGKKQ